jgi:hypothetical protein
VGPLFIIDDLFVWLPLNIVLMVAEQIQERIGGQGGGQEEAKLRKQLIELRLRFEMDDIDEETYSHETAAVTKRLRWLRAQEEEGADHAGDT